MFAEHVKQALCHHHDYGGEEIDRVVLNWERMITSLNPSACDRWRIKRKACRQTTQEHPNKPGRESWFGCWLDSRHASVKGFHLTTRLEF
jgi:hypothetical protein